MENTLFRTLNYTTPSSKGIEDRFSQKISFSGKTWIPNFRRTSKHYFQSEFVDNQSVPQLKHNPHISLA